ncbi:MAG: twin-arginine translocation signal domain-containing protein, partial [Deltaproteobacteria bacterium]|nr:twin-arginine translocation signal domain-containing protein [Deltaproteobacteria bacterium]
MSATKTQIISRRRFLQLSGALAATTAVAGHSHVLYALTRDTGGKNANEIREV